MRIKMASGNYNEVTHAQDADVNSRDPLYRWDTHFPERFSKLHVSEVSASPTARRTKRQRNRTAGRYKTQPITFDEIKEVDEDSNNTTSPDCADSKAGIRCQFAAFSKSMDGLLPGAFPKRVETKREPSTDSNKENTPNDDAILSSVALSQASPKVLAEKSGGKTNTVQSLSSSPPSTITDAATGMKIPTGLALETGRSRRKPRKRNKGIVEESSVDPEKNGEK